MLNEIRSPLVSRRKITTMLFVIGVVLSGLAFYLAEAQFARNMQNKRLEVDTRNSNLAIAVGQNLNRSLAQADTILLGLKAEMEADGKLDEAHMNLAQSYLAKGIFNQISVADSQGQLTYSAQPLKAPMSIFDRSHFQAHYQKKTEELYISAPRVLQKSGEKSILLSRRLNGPGGKFAGIVTVGLAVEYFSREMAKFEIGEHSSIMLLLMDGTMLVRLPDADTEQFLSAVKTNRALEQVRQGVFTGVYESRGLADGVVRVGAFNKLADFPAIVTVAISKEEAFRAIVARGTQYRWWAAMFSVVLWLLLLLLWRQLGKTYQAQEQLQLANEDLEEKVEARTSQLQAVNQELTAQNQEMAALNETVRSMNEGLEQLVEERTGDLSAANEELTAQYQELWEAQQREQRAAAVQLVLKEIAEAASFAPTLELLYASIHQFIGEVLPAALFHINFLDEDAGEIVRPFRADEVSFIPARRPAGKGLAEYTMRQGKAVLLNEPDLKKMLEQGEYWLPNMPDPPIRQYLGAPLVDSKGKIFGGLAFLTREQQQGFQAEDIETISIIAVQVSMAIERKRAEADLRSTEEHLQKLIRYASAPIIVWNPDFIVTRFNRAFEQLSGYGQAEVVGRPLSLLFPPDELTEVMSRIEQTRRGERWEAVEIPILRKEGSIRITLWNSANIYAADAVTLTAVIAQGQDITERVHREQESRRNEEAARRVQLAQLTEPEPSEFLNVFTVYEPLGYIGGDMFYLNWRYGGKMLRGFLVDVTGHGVATALHTASLHTLLREVNELDFPLADTMRWLNRKVREYFSEGIFAGAVAFEFDLEIRQLRWVCAGVPELWLVTKEQQGKLKCPGMCLGIREEETFDIHSIPIDVGDCFYFMTDGLAELLEMQEEWHRGSFRDTVGLLQNLSLSAARRDDATAICIRVEELPHSLVRADGWPRIIRFNGYGDYQRLKGEVAKVLMEVTGLPHSLQEVAVNEALANAMECRDGVPRPHKARLRFNKIGNRLIVRVKTSRIGFAGNAILRRLSSQPENMFSYGEDASMGRGIPMMLTMSDKMLYNSEGTEVLLAWKIRDSSGDESC